MLPRIGVYEYDIDLVYVLMEHYHSVSNRHLLHHLITEPFYDIRTKLREGTSNPYILREKHRKWSEYLREHMGEWIDLPSWADIEGADDTGCCFHGIDCCLCDHLFADGPEWVLYGDDVDLAYDLLDKLHTPLLVDDNVQTVVEKLLETNPEMKDLIVVSDSVEAIYVIRSSQVENCGEVPEPRTGFHAFANLASGEVKGDVPTYVLNDETIEAFIEVTRKTCEGAAC